MNATLYYAIALWTFCMGAVVGSFLNVCIHRWPRELSVSRPRRSFCPHCQRTLTWRDNIPIFSWLVLRGRCRTCGKVIPARYVVVEVLSAVLFLILWWRYPEGAWVAYAVFASLMIVATFVDLEHTIIPDQVTLGGIALGLLAAIIFPSLVGAEGVLRGVIYSLLGAAVGFGSLWLVAEVGKWAFGKRHLRWEQPAAFSIERMGQQMALKIEGESLPWEEIFARPSDRLTLDVVAGTIGGRSVRDEVLHFSWDRYWIDDQCEELEKLEGAKGRLRWVKIPREAMGFGDVKLMGGIGAFFGWKAVVFTVFSASILGMLIAGGAVLLGRREWSEKIPFGPYLCAGALLWAFAGASIWQWYFRGLSL